MAGPDIDGTYADYVQHEPKQSPNLDTLTITANGCVLTIRPYPDGGATIEIEGHDGTADIQLNAASYRGMRVFLTNKD